MEKLIVVTGGTKGIGRAIVEKFAFNGFDIATCARNTDDLIDLRQEIEQKYKGIKLFYCPADLSQPADRKAFLLMIKELGRPVHILVNNTGAFVPGNVTEEDEGILEQQLSVNLLSAYHVTRGILPLMKGSGKRHIFNMCSTASIMAYTNGGSYCISKFALYGFTKVLRQELKESQIRVTAILPGATLTDSWKGVALPPTRFMKPEDVATAVCSAWEMSAQSVVEEILIRPQLGDL